MTPADIYLDDSRLLTAVLVLAVVVLLFMAWNNRPRG
jgi:hypothetical protein